MATSVAQTIDCLALPMRICAHKSGSGRSKGQGWQMEGSGRGGVVVDLY